MDDHQERQDPEEWPAGMVRLRIWPADSEIAQAMKAKLEAEAAAARGDETGGEQITVTFGPATKPVIQ